MSLFSDDYLIHKQGNTKGSKWGYNYGKSNGKRKAGELQTGHKGDPVQTQSDAAFDPSTATIKDRQKVDGWVLYQDVHPKDYEEYKEYIKKEDEKLKKFYSDARNEQRIKENKELGKTIIKNMLGIEGPLKMR